MSTNDIQQTSTPDADNCGALRTKSGPKERDWYAEYLSVDRVLMVIHSMIDHAFSADDKCPGDHVIERLYNLIAAIHPEGALPNPLSEYMEHAEPTQPGAVEEPTIKFGRAMGKTMTTEQIEAMITPPAERPTPDISEAIGRAAGDHAADQTDRMMTERPTPITDAATFNIPHHGADGTGTRVAVVHYQVARNLERQLAEAREQRDRLANAIINAADVFAAVM